MSSKRRFGVDANTARMAVGEIRVCNLPLVVGAVIGWG